MIGLFVKGKLIPEMTIEELDQEIERAKDGECGIQQYIVFLKEKREALKGKSLADE